MGLTCHVSKVISLGTKIMHGHIKTYFRGNCSSFPQFYTRILFDLKKLTLQFFQIYNFWF